MNYCKTCGFYPCLCGRYRTIVVHTTPSEVTWRDTTENAEVTRLLNEIEVALRSMRNPGEAKRILRAALQRHGRRVGQNTGD